MFIFNYNLTMFNNSTYNKTQLIMKEVLYYMGRVNITIAMLDRFTLFMPDLEKKIMKILSDKEILNTKNIKDD